MALIKYWDVLSLRGGLVCLKAWTSSDPAAGNAIEAVMGEISFFGMVALQRRWRTSVSPDQSLSERKSLLISAALVNALE